jgi:hypothetical protein
METLIETKKLTSEDIKMLKKADTIVFFDIFDKNINERRYQIKAIIKFKLPEILKKHAEYGQDTFDYYIDINPSKIADYSGLKDFTELRHSESYLNRHLNHMKTIINKLKKDDSLYLDIIKDNGSGLTEKYNLHHDQLYLVVNDKDKYLITSQVSENNTARLANTTKLNW